MTVTIPTIPPDLAPAVPPRVRTVAYFAAFGIGVAGSMVVGIVGVIEAGGSPTAITAGIVGVVVATAATVAGGLGAAFRPTAGLPAAPRAGSPELWGDGSPVSSPVVGD